jgi:two-component system chemotaxis response regulator CheB
MRNILKQVLTDAGVTIAGEAGNGQIAADLVGSLNPDLVLMDFNMPIMNGLQGTGKIMARNPTPIIIFSNEVDAQLSYQAIQAGAVEVMAKPDLDKFNDPKFIEQFLATLRAAAATKESLVARGARPLSPPTPTQSTAPQPTRPATTGMLGRAAAYSSAPSPSASQVRRPSPGPRNFDAVVIGASTGGPVAVRDLLSALPGDFPLGIALVQHIEDRFDAGYATWLDGLCALSVRLAKDGDSFTPGQVVVAPGNRHLICSSTRLSLDDGPKVGNQKPAVDRLFETAAKAYKTRVIGVLLTGMGADGADGCVAIKGAGGTTLVQDQATSFIYGMPKAAAERGGASRILPLGDIARVLLELAGYYG